jgi:predicted regulator of Ras-like GTPase activity (Roadblock/LC7/MglB family)
MTLSFVDLFQKVKARLFPIAESKSAPSRLVRVEKPSELRLSKTVLPNAARARTAAASLQAAAGAASIQRVSPPVGPRSIPFDPGRRPAGSRELPKKIAFAPEAPVERAISLQLADILDQLPGDQIKPVETFDAARAIVLKASEIEKGMASGKPSVSLASVYEQAPEIFLNSVSPGDPTPVLLPFTKVLEQFEKLQVRTDQVHDNSVPQLETPFLKVTLEDTERFGTTMQAVQTSSHPPVKVEPAIAETLAAAEPEAVVSETAISKPPLRPTISLRELDTAESTSVAPVTSEVAVDKEPRDIPPVAPPKIPFHLPPNGTGEPASEKVPASSGPSVPTTPTPAAPSRIPFKFSAPCEDIRPKFTLVPGVEPNEKAPPAKQSAAPTKDASKVALSLQSLLQNLPAFQLNGSPMSVSEDALVEFPLSLIEPQLASGRVMVPAKVFQRAIPEMHRELFVVDLNETPVALALPEVLKHLPPAALRMRDDQEEMALKEKFTTPFSIQADEDEKRFNASNATSPTISDDPGGKPQVEEPTTVAPAKVEKIELKAEEKKIDAKEAMARASALPGVAACVITFADGLSLAGSLPEELSAEGVCAMAPSLLQRIDDYLPDTKLGSLKAVTLHCAKSPLTFFMHENICLMALHTPGQELVADTRDKLVTVVQELSRTFSQPEPSHVDH